METGWSKKNNLEKTIAVGIHGTPQLKENERRRFLGFFRERVVEAVTFRQISTKQGAEAIARALKHGQANELVVHGDARSAAMPAIKLARQYGVDFTVTTNPKFVGPVAVVVVAKTSVDAERVFAEEEEKL